MCFLFCLFFLLPFARDCRHIVADPTASEEGEDAPSQQHSTARHGIRDLCSSYRHASHPIRPRLFSLRFVPPLARWLACSDLLVGQLSVVVDERGQLCQVHKAGGVALSDKQIQSCITHAQVNDNDTQRTGSKGTVLTDGGEGEARRRMSDRTE